MHRRASILIILFGFICAGTFGTIATTGGSGEALAKKKETLIFFIRHGEDHVSLIDHGDGTFTEDCVDDCCLETLNPVGELRATLLSEFFREERIAERLTHVIASHKIRTRQTVEEIASDAGLFDDVDQNPGDGVQQIPPFVGECDEGFESSSSSRDPMIAALALLPLGSRVAVGAHSPTIYPIMESFGIDTSDPVVFPRRPNGKVDGFDNLWVVSVDRDGEGRLEEHIVLDFELVEQDRRGRGRGRR